jgi:hypothetical protein
MSGYIGKEMDYFSFGMILLELLDKNPLKELDNAVILNELATRSITIPQTIESRYQLLLKGLLTRDPKKRWHYKEVKEWLEGATPKTYFNEETNQTQTQETYKFKNHYYSKEALAREFIKQDNFEDAIKHIARGYITKYLEKIEEYDEAIKLDEFQTPLQKLIYFIYSQEKALPFSLYGVVIDEDYMFDLLLKFTKNQLNEVDKKVFDLHVKGELVELCNVYKKATASKIECQNFNNFPKDEINIYNFFDIEDAVKQEDVERVENLLIASKDKKVSTTVLEFLLHRY